jgi:hypothetical protein
MFRRRPLALALIVVGAGIAVWALTTTGGGPQRVAPPAAEHGLEIALQDDAVFTHRLYYDSNLAYRQARELGVSWLRITVTWSSAAGSSANALSPPASVPWSFGQYDSAVDQALANGVKPELSLTGPAPAWASGDGKVGPARPNAALYGQFVRAVAQHFRGRVTRYSIWNEPNYVGWIRPLAAAPGIYRALYLAGYGAVKAADPAAQVLIGETAAYGRPGRATPPLAFLRELACAGCGRLVADGFAHHPYELGYDFGEAAAGARLGPDDVTIETLGRLTGALDTLAREGRLTDSGGRALDVYLTEFGYFASGRRALAPVARAQRLTRAFALAERAYPRVRQMLQYLLVAPPRVLPGGRFDTSLVSSSGAPTPAFEALAAWASGALRAGRMVAPGRVR